MQELDRHVVRNAPSQLDRAGVGQHGDVDLRQRETRVLLHDDDVGAEHDLESAAAGDAVDGGDERLVQVARVIEAAESAGAPVRVRLLRRGGAPSGPSRREEAVARAGHDRHAQLASSRNA